MTWIKVIPPAEADGQLAAYAYASPWRPKPAYRHTVEDSIFVAPGMTGSLALTITDDSGKQIRRMTVTNDAGIHRVTWNLRPDPAAAPAGGGGAGGGGGRGGFGGAPMVEPGHYTATLGKPIPIRYVRFAAAITHSGSPDSRKRTETPAVITVATHGTSLRLRRASIRGMGDLRPTRSSALGGGATGASAV